MRNFNAKDYTDLIEKSENQTIKQYTQDEKVFLQNVPNLNKRIVVDLGAGHGRTMIDIADKTKQFIGIEINPQMYLGLVQRAMSIPNTKAVQGDITMLNKLMTKITSEEDFIFLIMQNSLGTIEGAWSKVIEELKIMSLQQNNELVISFFKSPKLQDEGVKLYKSLEPMVGEIDYENSELEKGLLMTKTGYTSKWWSEDDIKGIFTTLNAEILREYETETYCMFHLKLNANKP
jgi:SAM-dependent methyltransferase